MYYIARTSYTFLPCFITLPFLLHFFHFQCFFYLYSLYNSILFMFILWGAVSDQVVHSPALPCTRVAPPSKQNAGASACIQCIDYYCCLGGTLQACIMHACICGICMACGTEYLMTGACVNNIAPAYLVHHKTIVINNIGV